MPYPLEEGCPYPTDSDGLSLVSHEGLDPLEEVQVLLLLALVGVVRDEERQLVIDIPANAAGREGGKEMTESMPMPVPALPTKGCPTTEHRNPFLVRVPA